MTNKQRLELIEQYIRENKYADLHTLAEKFETSLSTIRRALNDLEAKGIVRRHHGGASLLQDDLSTKGYDFIAQDDRQTTEKLAIARAIADQIEDGMTVILDGGTSTYSVARQLINKRLVIVTNSLPIAALFGDIGTCETIVTGGTVYSRLSILYGPTCEMSLRQVHADIAVLGGAGINDAGIWNNNNFIVSVQKHIIDASDKAYFSLDHTKFGRRALNMTTEFDPKLTIVTDKQPDKTIASAIQVAGASLTVA